MSNQAQTPDPVRDQQRSGAESCACSCTILRKNPSQTRKSLVQDVRTCIIACGESLNIVGIKIRQKSGETFSDAHDHPWLEERVLSFSQCIHGPSPYECLDMPLSSPRYKRKKEECRMNEAVYTRDLFVFCLLSVLVNSFLLKRQGYSSR